MVLTFFFSFAAYMVLAAFVGFMRLFGWTEGGSPRYHLWIECAFMGILWPLVFYALLKTEFWE